MNDAELRELAEKAIQVLAKCALDDGEDLKLGYRVTQTRMMAALRHIGPDLQRCLTDAAALEAHVEVYAAWCQANANWP